MRRPWFLFFYLLAVALAQTAGFTVEPAGNQSVNLTTGIVTLPQGGRIVAPEHGVVLRAPYIEYKEGEFVEAREAEVTWHDSEVKGGEISIDLVQQKAELTRGVALKIPALTEVKAQTATMFLAGGVAVLAGSIESDSPTLNAEQAVVDLESQEVILVGPFSYIDKSGFRLSGTAADAMLYLKLGSEQSITANTIVEPATWERLSPYLETSSD